MKLFVPVVLLLLALISFALSHPVIPSAEQTSYESPVLDIMEPSESKVKKFYKRTGYGYGGYVLPAVVPRYYPTFGATVLVGYPLLTGSYGGYGGVIPHYLSYGYGR
uniref:Uncharacterized protein n=1 Tax=Daphnia galeata TaxID=27404 RepID=A0A8J2WNY7_9CRUS|nr:unnamed protein product [Daphnia galeata]